MDDVQLDSGGITYISPVPAGHPPFLGDGGEAGRSEQKGNGLAGYLQECQKPARTAY